MARRLFLARAHRALLVAATLAANASSISRAMALPPDTPTNIQIGPQALATALQALSEQAGLQVGFESQLVKGIQTQGTHGSQTPAQALTNLLKGTKLEYRFINNQTVVVREKAQPQSSSGPPSARDVRVAQADPHPGDTPDGESSVTTTPTHAESGAASKDGAALQLDEVVVTGTHIRGAPLSSPVIEISQVDIERSGYTNVGDVIRSLPQNFSGGNNPQNIGASATLANDNSDNAGTSPNLRGLGSGSTLTLVNGHRLADDTTDGGTDISFLPLAAIERIDVLTDGASAAYGADAVGGVVNFILKKDFDGAQTSVLVGNSTDGGAHQVQFSQLLGKSWDSGGVILAYRYDKEAPVYSSERSFAAEAAQPLSLLPGSELRSYFLSAHQDIATYGSAFVDVLYGSRSAFSAVTFPGSDNFVGYGNSAVKQYDVNAGFTAKLPGDWQVTTVASSAVNLAYSTFTGQVPIDEDGRTRSIEANAEGALFALPAGNVRLALGGGYRREVFKQWSVGNLAGGERRVSYGYGELAIPIIGPSQDLLVHGLDLNLSGREDDYSDTGRRSVPKIGLVLAPTRALALRASWGKSFRAPPLADKYGYLYLLEMAGFPDPSAPTGASQVLVPSGSNPALKPESALSKTFGFDYTPARLPGFKVSASYFDLAYSNRIITLPDLYGALESATFAPFVTRNPSAAQQQSLITAAAASGGVYNYTGGTFDPAQTAAIVSYEYTNAARQDLRGVDLLLNYKVSWTAQVLDLFSNATYLNFRETLSPGSPRMTLSGTAFYPPKIKLRSGATWNYGPVATTGVVNYMGGEVNTFAAGEPHVASWTTVDLHIAYLPTWTGWLSGLSASLSVRNLFDKDPPYVQYLGSNFPGANFDSNNASPLGRFVSLQLGKRW